VRADGKRKELGTDCAFAIHMKVENNFKCYWG